MDIDKLLILAKLPYVIQNLLTESPDSLVYFFFHGSKLRLSSLIRFMATSFNSKCIFETFIECDADKLFYNPSVTCFVCYISLKLNTQRFYKSGNAKEALKLILKGLFIKGIKANKDEIINTLYNVIAIYLHLHIHLCELHL